jgi:hypothetical protein
VAEESQEPQANRGFEGERPSKVQSFVRRQPNGAPMVYIYTGLGRRLGDQHFVTSKTPKVQNTNEFPPT